MHAATTIGDPCWQRSAAHALACGDVFIDPCRHLLPVSRLPGFKRALCPAVAPADCKVHVACGVGDVGQMESAVVEQVAEAGPQELRLRVLAGAQLGELFHWILELEDLHHFRRGGTVGRAIVLLVQIKHHDVFADFAEDTCAGFLPQRALADQRL